MIIFLAAAICLTGIVALAIGQLSHSDSKELIACSCDVGFHPTWMRPGIEAESENHGKHWSGWPIKMQLADKSRRTLPGDKHERYELFRKQLTHMFLKCPEDPDRDGRWYWWPPERPAEEYGRAEMEVFAWLT